MKYNRIKQHIIGIYLDYIGIRYSRKYLYELLLSNPDSDTFAGIRSILLNYKIHSKGLKTSLSNLNGLCDPVIIQLNKKNESNLVLLIENGNNVHTYITELGDRETVSSSKLEEYWTGFILFPEVTVDSKEKDYQNKVVEYATWIKGKLIPLLFFLILISFYNKNCEPRYSDIPFLFLYLGGFIICILLFMQSLGIKNHLAKKICEINKQTSCSTVLNSKSAKLFNLIGWSEIGIIYFMGSLLSFIFIPLSIPLLFWLNILSLPYTFWSVIFQRYFIRKWCVLCLIVQFIFWLLFVTFIYNGISLYPLNFDSNIFVIFMICYIAPSFVLWFVVPILDKANRFDSLLYNYNKLKTHKTIFNTLLNEQKLLDLDPLARSLCIGKKEASLTVTIISNPYCGHCATIHKQMMIFFEKYPNDIKIEFVFVGETFMEGTIKFLITVYFRYKYEEITLNNIYSEWYEKKDKILDFYTIDVINENVNKIYLAQRKWLDNKETIGTPAIYVNDRELPEGYTIEDLRYFI